MKKPAVHFRSSGESGNIYAILAKCSAALLKVNRIEEWNTLAEETRAAGSYEKALKRIRQTVELIDDDGRY